MSPIGLFDSGKGGLSVMAAAEVAMPEQQFIYLADNNGSYGQLSSEKIYQYTRQGVEKLFQQGARLVVLACNTASAVALRKLQQEWLAENYPDHRVLGVIVPTIEQLAGHHHLGILATPATVASRYYEAEVKKLHPQMQITFQPCPDLAGIIESGDEAEIKKQSGIFLRQLLKKNPNLDSILLGCTHYSLKHDLFRELVPENINLFDQPRAVANSLREYTSRHPDIVK